MKNLRTVLFSVMFALILGNTAAIGQKADPPKLVANNFYAQLFYLNIRGLPDDDQLTAISPFLSKEVTNLIIRNQKKQMAFINKHPDEKPPWAESDLFSSLFEGTTAFIPGKVRKRSGWTEVDVKLEYLADGNYTKWIDTANLKRIGGKWVITNILYKGKWQFKSGSSLLNALK